MENKCELSESVTNIWAIPDNSTHLREYFKDVSWDCANKKLHIIVAETNKLSAFKWFTSLSIENTITICIYHKDQHSKLRFGNLRLDAHACHLRVNEQDDPTPLEHAITLAYDKLEIDEKFEKFDVNACEEDSFDIEWNKTDLKMVTTA